MAIRFTVNGQEYSVDTPEEAIQLRHALLAQLQSAAPRPRVLVKLPSPAPLPSATFSATGGDLLRSPAEIVFPSAEHGGALAALIHAWPEGVDTTEMVAALKLKTPKSLPPLIGIWGKRAANLGLELKNLLRVNRSFVHGKALTKYALTEEGMKVFGGMNKPEERHA